jgi:hypothetical protein
MAAMAMVCRQSDENETQSFGKKTKHWITIFIARSVRPNKPLHREKRTQRAGNGEGDLLFFFSFLKNKESDVPFAQADVGTAVQVPLASQGGNFSPQCCHQKTAVQMTKSVFGNIKNLGRWQCCSLML